MCIAAGKKANGGCNCLSPQAVLLPRGWAQVRAAQPPTALPALVCDPHIAGGLGSCPASVTARAPRPLPTPLFLQASAFRAALEKQLRTQPTQPAYYPGSKERRAATAARYGSRAASVGAGAPRQGAAADDDETLLVACGGTADRSFDGDVLTSEAFGAVLALVEARSPPPSYARTRPHRRPAALNRPCLGARVTRRHAHDVPSAP